MTALLASVLAASVVGSPHCAGMCGGLVAVCTASGDGARSRGALWIYHLARLLSYAAVGALAGSLGLALDLGGGLVGMQRIAAIAAGATIALVGVGMLLRLAGMPLGCVRVPRRLSALLAAVQRRAMAHGPATRSAIIGVATPLLPCGWLWAFAAVAAGAASPLWGAIVMVAFWLGTVPILTAVGLGLSWIPAGVKRHLAAVAAVAMIAVGLHTAMVRGSGAEAVAAQFERLARGGDAAAAVDRIAGGAESPACCAEPSR